MPPVIQAVATGFDSGSPVQGIDLTHGFTIEEGDLLVALTREGLGGSRQLLEPAGWTQDFQYNVYNWWRLYYKVATASEPATYEWGASDVYGQHNLVMLHITGAVDPVVTPIVHAHNIDDGSGTGPKTCPSITPTQDDSLVLAIMVDGSQGQNASTDPAGSTRVVRFSGRYTQIVASYTHDAAPTGTKQFDNFSIGWHTIYDMFQVAIAPPVTSVPEFFGHYNYNTNNLPILTM